jgi:GT2 family glycosyltransferase
VGHGQEACYLVRREAVVDAGAQDERFVLDWEGIDWSARIGQSGWEIWFCPSATIRHEGGASVRQARIRWVAGTHRGMYRYFAKRRPLVLRPFLLAAFAARGAAKALTLTVSPDQYERAQDQARL